MGNMADEKAENGFSMMDDVETTMANDGRTFPDQSPSTCEEIEDRAQDRHDFMELYEESLKSIQEGKVVKGEIVQIDSEFVLVDIGYKSEGQIRINEFMNSAGRMAAKVGQEVEVLLVRKEDSNGRLVLSREKAEAVKRWDDVEEIFKNQGTIRGTILSRIKGGLSVDIGIRAFLPGSQADLRPIRDLDSLIGTENDFMILKCEKRKGNIVLSRRALLEETRKALREKTLELLEKDAVLHGIVGGIADFGLFIDLGGIDGLVHINDISWRRVGHPSDMFHVGDEVTVKVLNFDREKERVSLGIKQLTPDPWQEAQEKYKAGTTIMGRVVGLKEYGAFIEIAEGMEGLVHVSEMSWTEKIGHPSQILNVGDEVEVMILGIDSAKKRISLSIKQLTPDPWDVVRETYKPGTLVEGTITTITDFGLFVELESGIEGLAHISELPNDKRKNPLSHFQVGDVVQAKVIGVSLKDKKIRLSMQRPDEGNEEDISYYVADHKGVTSNLGEILKLEYQKEKNK